MVMNLKMLNLTSLPFCGNNEDDFMIGIKFTRKTIKLFSDFHTYDIIIASALCLVNKIEEAGFNKEKDVDFLSSIEVDALRILSLEINPNGNLPGTHGHMPTKPLETDSKILNNLGSFEPL
ncbi:hypothetical protein VNO78_12108 [Psophocarpus tetragonolobus]|uniref:UTP25 NTP hydrolase-like domain-containing protein n=1 Tax=Psophocarpus tetragonolobus TaxID=3891 RepID=A0AAN9SND2_PSOTE